jgi:hypothetical protein
MMVAYLAQTDEEEHYAEIATVMHRPRAENHCFSVTKPLPEARWCCFQSFQNPLNRFGDTRPDARGAKSRCKVITSSARAIGRDPERIEPQSLRLRLGAIRRSAVRPGRPPEVVSVDRSALERVASLCSISSIMCRASSRVAAVSSSNAQPLKMSVRVMAHPLARTCAKMISAQLSESASAM